MERVEGLLNEQRRKVANLLGEVADRRSAQAALLSRRPQVEASQRRLVQTELALAAQREQVRAEGEVMLRNAGLSGPEPAVQPSAPRPAERPADSRCETSTSYFLPSETSSLPPAYGDIRERPYTPPLTPKAEEPQGAPPGDVEIGPNSIRPDLEGARATVAELRGDSASLRLPGGSVVELPRAAFSPAGPLPLEAQGGKTPGARVKVTLPQGTALEGTLIGFRYGTLLVDFSPRGGVLQVPPDVATVIPTSDEVVVLRDEVERLKIELEAERAKAACQPASPDRRAALARLAAGASGGGGIFARAVAVPAILPSPPPSSKRPIDGGLWRTEPNTATSGAAAQTGPTRVSPSRPPAPLPAAPPPAPLPASLPPPLPAPVPASVYALQATRGDSGTPYALPPLDPTAL